MSTTLYALVRNREEVVSIFEGRQPDLRTAKQASIETMRALRLLDEHQYCVAKVVDGHHVETYE